MLQNNQISWNFKVKVIQTSLQLSIYITLIILSGIDQEGRKIGNIFVLCRMDLNTGLNTFKYTHIEIRAKSKFGKYVSCTSLHLGTILTDFQFFPFLWNSFSLLYLNPWLGTWETLVYPCIFSGNIGG